MITVTDPEDPRLADYRSLKDVSLRRRLEPAGGLYIAESAQVIQQALAAGHRPRSVLVATDRVSGVADVIEGLDRDVPVLVADYSVLRGLTGFHVHRGVLASMHRPSLQSWESIAEQAQRIVVLEDIVDHTNLGAVFRSAVALGWDAVLLTPRCADPLYRRSVRVSMGAVFHVPWARLTQWPGDLAALGERGFTTCALTPSPEAIDIRDFAPPSKLALLLGTEGRGLTGSALQGSTVQVRIPMAAQVDSLNIAAAAAIGLWTLGSA